MPDSSAPISSIGHNSGAVPLAELLIEETAELVKRRDLLIEGASRAVVTDEESAGKATLMVALLKKHADEMETAREARKKPFWDAGKTVDIHFKTIAAPMDEPTKRTLGLIDTWRREQEQKAIAERLRLEDEAKRQREIAEAAHAARLKAEADAKRAEEEAARRVQAAQDAARKAGDATKAAEIEQQRLKAKGESDAAEAKRREESLQAELDAARANDEADKLERAAKATTVAPIKAEYGGFSAGRRTTWTGTITDLKKAIAECIKVDEASMRAAAQKVIDAQIRAKRRAFPGVDIVEGSTTSVR